MKSMKEGKRVLVAAHGNSIRALVQYFENLKPEEIVDVNIPTGIPLVYEFDEAGKFIKKEYLGDPEAIKSKMEKVAAQGSASKYHEQMAPYSGSELIYCEFETFS